MTAIQDNLWSLDGERHGWSLPTKAPKVYRLPVIRTIRALYIAIKIERHNAFWSHSLGSIPSGYDEWVLYAIRRGWC